MDEFNNRIDAQRRVLDVVNSRRLWREELLGLSLNAIERWDRVNRCDDVALTRLLKEIGNSLLFLATKSQEQVSDDYRTLSTDVARLTEDLKAALG
jgi:hypothetical protein